MNGIGKATMGGLLAWGLSGRLTLKTQGERYKHDSRYYGSAKGGEFKDELSDSQFHRKNSCPTEVANYFTFKSRLPPYS
jgi:hypothetical protein